MISPELATRRDRATWIAYGFIGLYAYVLYALGSATLYLRSEFDLSQSVAGGHASAFAMGLIVVGIAGSRTRHRSSRFIWGAAACLVVAALGMALSPHPVASLAAALAMGAAGGALLAEVNAFLVRHHRGRAARVLAEANISASALSLVTPLLLGFLGRTELGWRVAFVVPVVIAIGLWSFGRGDWPVGNDLESDPIAQTPRSVPRRFWLAWTLVLVVVGVEFSIVFWGSALMSERLGLRQADAVAIMSVFVGGMLVGRIISAGAPVWPRIPGRALSVSLVLAGSGSSLVWLSAAPPLSVVGLAVTGLGVANLFPGAVAAAVQSAPRMESTAGALTTFGFGLALLIAPALLAMLSDRMGVTTAFGLVPMLVVVGWIVMWLLSLVGRRPGGDDASTRDTVFVP